jgi:hypothetical protein
VSGAKTILHLYNGYTRIDASIVDVVGADTFIHTTFWLYKQMLNSLCDQLGDTFLVSLLIL